METTHELLDLICVYCDRDPVQEGAPILEDGVSRSLSVFVIGAASGELSVSVLGSAGGGRRHKEA